MLQLLVYGLRPMVCLVQGSPRCTPCMMSLCFRVCHLKVLLTPARHVRHALNEDGIGPFQILLPVLDLLLESLHAGQTLLPVAALEAMQDSCTKFLSADKGNQ